MGLIAVNAVNSMGAKIIRNPKPLKGLLYLSNQCRHFDQREESREHLHSAVPSVPSVPSVPFGTVEQFVFSTPSLRGTKQSGLTLGCSKVFHWNVRNSGTLCYYSCQKITHVNKQTIFTYMRKIIRLLCVMILSSCNNTHSTNINKEKQKVINDYNKYIFSLKTINSKDIIDSLIKLSDTVFTDTATYFRTPKATLYVNTKAGTINRVFENPKGTITAIMYIREGKEIYVAEYFRNGLVMCQFSVTDSGIRQGPDTCYYHDGKIRFTGYYKDNHQVKEQSIDYPENNTEAKVLNLVEQQAIVKKEINAVDSLSKGKRKITLLPILDDTTKNIYIVKVGEDNGDSFVTHLSFRVDANKMKIIK